ncbi:MAG TPA: tRNA uridine-5-carboxymethylaminomethyl(34) synthesis GTPase MnmE, partial [Smithellaceae bacterium]|nr:tRNA uridine-5-carboxymethylaminomethyl(34) synthesis GTPase MnmE [Smithellaceae bacterium]
NCHGNPLIMQTIFQELIALGCRPAAPGEFSRRAFLNGRIDLAQAEALAAMIAAKSEKACAASLQQLKGALGREIDYLRVLLVDALAFIEAGIDFTDDIVAPEIPDIPPQLEIAAGRLQSLLLTYPAAKYYTDGINAVITGKPNAGKSSLLNSLTGKKRAIVNEIPGTTRDFITSEITVNGVSINLTDTAGIRQPQNAVEKEGIDLVWENLAQADVVIILLDSSRPLTNEDSEIIEKNKTSNVICAINKSDLPSTWQPEEIPGLPEAAGKIKISAKFGNGLDELKKLIVDRVVTTEEKNTDGLIVANLRHKSALEKTGNFIGKAKDSIGKGLSPEFAAFDLQEAIRSLDEITGRKIGDDVLDKVFSSFCIGK